MLGRVFLFCCFLSTIPVAAQDKATAFCLDRFPRLALGLNGNHLPNLANVDGPERPEIWIMSQESLNIGRPDILRDYKQQMENDTFEYLALENIISGVYHPESKTYFVAEGHHRLAAALEIAEATGNWAPFKKLVLLGKWDTVSEVPRGRAALPRLAKGDGGSTSPGLIRPITPRWNHFGLKALFQ